MNKTRSSTIAFICTTGLGEVLGQTSVWRSLYDSGKKIIVILLGYHLGDAFRGLPFVERLIECENEHLKYFPDYSVRLADSIVDQLNEADADIMTPMKFSHPLFHGNVYSQQTPIENPYYAPRKYPFCSTDHWAAACGGVRLSTYERFLGARKFIEVEHPAVGLCVGSNEVFRRLPDDVFGHLVDCLASKFNVFLFGQYYKVKHERVTSLIDSPRLGDSLDYIGSMDVFVNPDSGFSHVAATWGVPSIVIQGREIIEGMFPSFYWKNVIPYSVPNERLQCKKNCHGKMFELNIGNDPRPSAKWLEVERWAHRQNYPNCLECKITGVDCMQNIDPAEIEKLIRETLSKKHENML